MDSATQDQLDELRDAIDAAKRVRAATTRRQQALEEQAAKLGLDTPPQITTELVDLGLKIKAKTDEIRELERTLDRVLDGIAQLGSDQEAIREESREWRQHERTERLEGQGRRLLLAGSIAFVLFLIALGVLAIFIKVYS